MNNRSSTLIQTYSATVLVVLGLTATGAVAPEPNEEFSGGDTTVFDDSRNAFSFPAANLSAERRTQFFVGNSFFLGRRVARLDLDDRVRGHLQLEQREELRRL